MTPRMRAVSQRQFGGPEVLEVVEAERPSPGPGEVLVRVEAAAVNPADWKIRSGAITRFGEPPFTLGLDLAGVVEAVGPGVSRFTAGERVYGCALPPRGSYAEYTIAREGMLAAAPKGIDAVHAAALPVTALTAWQALVNVADVQPGQRVLVHAAAGGIGHLAVQIAKARGAHVVGTAREDKHAFLSGLGADELVDYTTTDFTSVLRDLDVVVDPVGEDYGPRSLDVLAPTGVLVDVRGSGPDRTAVRNKAKARGLRFEPMSFTPSSADLDRLTALVEGGGLRVEVSRVFPLERTAEAHALGETNRTRGKLVLVP
ncbi:NADP-dependent oxidoreductase [Streptomyces sp. NPDC050448]|uniref:NADP-dependent oxidoreductase n=1 Tax=Streptomyces sp. NPDC050448 TaxID=3155404 RepID=UPI003443EBDD